MIIVKDKSNNSQLCIARSNAALDKAIYEEKTVYVDENTLYEILRNYVRINEAAKQDEITQAEYDRLLENGQIEDDKLYIIKDAKISVPYIKASEMVEYVDDVVGQINNILEDIIG